MKRFCAVFLTVFLLLVVSCQGVGGGSASGEDSPYKEKSFLSFLVKYEDGSFLFSKTPWGASKTEWLKAMNLSEEDLYRGAESNEDYQTYIVKKPIYFEDITCPAAVIVEFYKDQFRLIRVSLTDDITIWADLQGMDISPEEEYPEVNMLQVVSKLADQIEAASMPEPETDRGIEGCLRVEDIRQVGASWWGAIGDTDTRGPVFEIGAGIGGACQ